MAQPLAPVGGTDKTNQTVNFTISGTKPLTATALSGQRYAALTVPTSLQGNVSTAGNASITTSITVDLNNIALLTSIFSAANTLTTNLTSILGGSLGSLTGVTLDTTQFYNSLNALQTVQNIGNGTFQSPTQFDSTGSYIYTNLDDGIGTITTNTVITLLQNLETATNNLQATGTGITGPIVATAINSALAPLKLALTTAVDSVLTPALNGTGNLTNQLINASVLGNTSIVIPTTVNVPSSLQGSLDAQFVGTVVQSPNLLDVNLLNTANGITYLYLGGTPATTTKDSNVTLAIAEGTQAVTPVDPENPTIPVTPVNPDPSVPIAPGTPGPLSIDFASSLSFGKQEISMSDQTYYAHPQNLNDGTTRENYVQVTDIRGTLAGWSLTVQTSAQFHLPSVDPTVTPEAGSAQGDYLSGAVLSFSGGHVKGTSTVPPSVVASSTYPVSTAATLIVSAGQKEGAGTWVYDLGQPTDYDTTAVANDAVASKGPVTLSLPSSTVKRASAYTTNLLWNLTDVPQNP